MYGKSGLDLAKRLFSVYAKNGRLDVLNALFVGMKDPDKNSMAVVDKHLCVLIPWLREVLFQKICCLRDPRSEESLGWSMPELISPLNLFERKMRNHKLDMLIYILVSCLRSWSACLKDARDLIKTIPMEPNHSVRRALR
ncbi:hypothetical protein DH2020_031237 [Rehmannia glutinosa]|uniref:Pentatricopeptide repeat-containing protein n=1 Tax=Rehmannia glutinosa TaxID=99300 RepID=A0ABR0VMK1_REHGL